MAISIFWRLILSHIGILLLSGAVCLYSIVQLGSLSQTAHSALDRNHRMIAYQEALTEAFLSQVRYGGKYLITHTEGRHEQLRQFKKDFVDYSTLLKRLGQSESIGDSLSRIAEFHEQYHELFDREVAYIRANQNYAQTRYQQERDKIVESTLNELDLLKAQLRTKLQEKLQSIDQGARTARRIAIVTTLIVLILGAILSLKVSRSMDGPMSEATAAQRVVGVPWTLALKSAGLQAIERSQHLMRLQAIRLPAIVLSLIAVCSRRSASSKHPMPRKGN